MKTLSIRKISALLLLLALPSLSFAIPMTWNYTGACTAGDCDVVPSVTGTLSGDPELLWPNDQLDQIVVFGDVTSYSFTIGSYVYSGSSALGNYQLDSSGNIVGGSMTFGDLFSLEFLDLGSATWSFSDTDCRFFIFCGKVVEASGAGGYSTVTAVPEPAMLSLLGFGLMAFGFVRRRRA